MIREITPPFGEEHTSRWWWALAAYAVALVGSTTTIGVLAGWTGAMVRDWIGRDVENLWVIVLIVIVLLYGLRELAIVRLPMPQIPWQVPAQWSRYGKVRQGLLYGLVLGADIFTLIPYPTFYAIFLLEAGFGVFGGGAIGIIYGLARAFSTVSMVAQSRLRRRDPSLVVDNIVCHLTIFHQMNGVVLLFAGQVMFMTLLMTK